MPFYEYQCSRCGHLHEELQKVGGRPLRKCPACGRSALRRLVSAPVFRLKGGGWYETDFKADKENKRNIAGEKEPPPEKPKDVKTDTKPATEVKPAADVKPATGAKAGADAKPATNAAPGKHPGATRQKAPARRTSLRRRRPRT